MGAPVTGRKKQKYKSLSKELIQNSGREPRVPEKLTGAKSVESKAILTRIRRSTIRNMTETVGYEGKRFIRVDSADAPLQSIKRAWAEWDGSEGAMLEVAANVE